MSQIRANLLIVDQQTILLIHRIKNGEEYYVFPGGSVEEGESVTDAAIREAKEETGLNVTLGKELWQYHNHFDNRVNHYFVATKYYGALKLGHPEVDRMSDSNKYILEWHGLNMLNDIKLFPIGIKEKVIKYFNGE